MESINQVQSALDAGAATGQIRTVDGAPFIVVPQNYKLQPLESMGNAPTRQRGIAVFNDVQSFIAYVADLRTPSTRLYGKVNPPAFQAVFNDHELGAPGFRDAVASYACPLSAEWKTWIQKNGRQMSQEEFAQFIEDNLPDIAMPPAAEMLEVSRSLEAKKKVNFASGIRLSNGQNELTYEETISGTAGKGKLAVPEEFTVGIPVLESGPRYAVTARLRYRIGEGGKLAMWFDLLRPHKVVEDAAAEVWKTIEQELGLTVLNGEPALS